MTVPQLCPSFQTFVLCSINVRSNLCPRPYTDQFCTNLTFKIVILGNLGIFDVFEASRAHKSANVFVYFRTR